VLARRDGDAGQWYVAGGTYQVALGRAADDLVLNATTEMNARHVGR
jgi:hypothetical protein